MQDNITMYNDNAKTIVTYKFKTDGNILLTLL